MRMTRTLSVVLDAAGVARALRRPAFLLRVMSGPDKRKQLKVSQARCLIGSGEGAAFRLDDATVSAAHCEICCDESGFFVRDLGAKNGVVLGGRKVREAWLDDTDDLTLGGSVVRFKLLDEAVDDELAAKTRSEERRVGKGGRCGRWR